MPQNHAVMVNPKTYGDNLFTDQGSLYFRKRVYFNDFSAAATTVNADVQFPNPWTHFPSGIEIEGAGLSLVTNFTGGGVTAATLSIGTTGAPTLYLVATDVFTGAYKTMTGAFIAPFTFLAGAGAPAQSTVRLQLVTTTANANLLTAGKADIYLKLRAVSIRTT